MEAPFRAAAVANILGHLKCHEVSFSYLRQYINSRKDQMQLIAMLLIFFWTLKFLCKDSVRCQLGVREYADVQNRIFERRKYIFQIFSKEYDINIVIAVKLRTLQQHEVHTEQ